MNNSPLIAVLTGVLGISALASVGMCYKCVTQFQQGQEFSARIDYIKNQELLIQGLQIDAIKYGQQRNPAINPTLEKLGLIASPSKTSAR